jgi:hypothetical protein
MAQIQESRSTPPGHHQPSPQLVVTTKLHKRQWRSEEASHQPSLISLSPLETEPQPTFQAGGNLEHPSPRRRHRRYHYHRGFQHGHHRGCRGPLRNSGSRYNTSHRCLHCMVGLSQNSLRQGHTHGFRCHRRFYRHCLPARHFTSFLEGPAPASLFLFFTASSHA